MSVHSHPILLAEDDQINQMVAKHLLQRLGYEVVGVTDGQAALEAFRQQPFALVFMDLEMPIMDGLEAARQIRQLPEGRDIPIVALTAHILPEKLEETKTAGMNDYLIKPFELHKFEAVLETYLSEPSGQ